MSAGMNFGLQGGAVLEAKAQYGSASQIVDKPADGAVTPHYDADAKVYVVPSTAPSEIATSKAWPLPVLVVVLAGGFADQLPLVPLSQRQEQDLLGLRPVQNAAAGQPRLRRAGRALWCSQLIFLKIGEPAMGDRAYIGWAVFMASLILFSTLLGIVLGEWKGTSARTRMLLAVGLLLLLGSSVAAGYSGYAKQARPKSRSPGLTG